MRLHANIKKWVPPPPARVERRYQRVVTKNIIETILYADSLLGKSTQPAAHLLRGETQEQTARNIWRYVSENIKYKKDAAGHERIKSPAMTIYDKYGDCKSFSVLIASFLKNHGIEYYYRFTGYPGDRNFTHVYVVAQLDNGRDIILDGTYDLFNREVAYSFKRDIPPGGSLEGINGQKEGTNIKKILGAIALFFIGASLLNSDYAD